MAKRDASWTMSATDLASRNPTSTTIWSTMPLCQSTRDSRLWQCPFDCLEV